MNDQAKKPVVDFSDLEGDFDVESRKGAKPSELTQALRQEFGGHTRSVTTQAGQFPCPRCGGSGRYTFGYVNIQTGKCHKCGGRGYFKTDPQKRAKAAQASRARKAAALTENVEAFKAEHPAAYAWLQAAANNGRTVNEFAESLLNGLYKYGSLTPNQLAAVERNVARDQERAAAAAAAQAAAIAAGPVTTGLDLSAVPAGCYAVPNGDTRLKVRIRRPKAPSRWVGFTFVDDGAVYGQQQNYGRQAPGKPYSGKIEAQLRQIAADPKAAMAAYGHLVGRCGCCGRPLEDAESVARGIGPVCAAKYGW